jgi:hypothetical protein
MATATYNKFQDFVEQLGKGVHQLHAAGHTFEAYLSNATPSASADAVKADLAGITEQNGYAEADIQNDYTETSGTGTMTAVDIVFTGTGAGFGPFRYVVIFNETAASDPLMAWFDYGSEITLVGAGETFTIDFGASLLTIA